MTRNDILQMLSKFQQDRRGEFGIIRLGVFGSTARDQFSDESDVDVVVELAHPDLFALIGIKQELEAALHCPVDVVRYRENMNAFLKRRIQPESPLLRHRRGDRLRGLRQTPSRAGRMRASNAR